MRKNIVCIAIAAFVCVFVAVSCQEDSVTENVSGTLSTNSPLTALLTAMSANETAGGNVIDSTDCFTIQLPVEVTANGQQILVSTEADYATVAAVFNQSSDDTDSIELGFPVTVIYPDYTQVTVGTQQQYNALVTACNGVINSISSNCIAINYPITIFGYDSNFQVENTYVLNSNEELFAMLLAMGDNNYYSLDFPVSLTIAGQGVVSAGSNTELEQLITQAVAACNGVVPEPVGCQNPGVLVDGLMFYMPFSNSVADLKGNAVIAPADTTFVADRAGNPKCAILFNGNYQLHIPSATANELVQGDAFSVSLWFRMDDEENGNLEHFFTKGNENGVGFEVSAYDMNTPLFWAGQSGVWDTPWNTDQTLWADHNWHHLVVSVDVENTILLYRDGVLRNSATFSSADIAAQAMDYYIGAGFYGALDDLRVYKRALSQQEVQTLFELEGDCNTCLE